MFNAYVVHKGYNNGTLVVDMLFTDSPVTEVAGPGGTTKIVGSPTAHQAPVTFTLRGNESLDNLVRAKLEELNALEATNAKVAPSKVAFTPAPLPVETPDLALEAKSALRAALSDYEMAARVQAADPAFDITKFKQAVVDAQASLDAVAVAAPVGKAIV